MRDGRRLRAPPPLAETRARAADGLMRLPERLRRLEPAASYPVRVAERLVTLAAEVDRRLQQQDGNLPAKGRA